MKINRYFILGIFLAICALFSLPEIVNSGFTAIVTAIIFAFLSYLSFKKSKTYVKKVKNIPNVVSPTEEVIRSKPKYKYFYTKVKGITFKNEDNKDTQQLLKSLLSDYRKNYFEKDELYDGKDNDEILDYTLEVTEFEGQTFDGAIKYDTYEGNLCIKVYFIGLDGNPYHIGYIPKEEIERVKEFCEFDYDLSLEITGGNVKYGDYENENCGAIDPHVVTEKLTYGCNLTFRKVNI